MAKRVQRFGVDAGTMAALIGKAREFIVNTTRNSIHVHDGVNPGGVEVMRADGTNGSLADSSNQGLLSAVFHDILAGIGALPVPVASGGTGASSAATARTNLDVPQTTAVPPNARQIISGNGLTGGGDLSADRTLAVGAGTGIAVSADAVAIDKATQADMEAQTANKVVTADNFIHHALSVKAWGKITIAAGVPTFQQGFGIASVVSNGSPGRYKITFTTPFSSAQYGLFGCASNAAAGELRGIQFDDSLGSTAAFCNILIAGSGGDGDAPNISVFFFGDQ